MAFLKARDAKKRAKTALKEAKATYEQACSGLEQMRDNFNAAFESSEEPKEWRNYEKVTISKVENKWSLTIKEFDYKRQFAAIRSE